MGTGDLAQLKVYYAWNEKAYPRDAMRTMFVSNHDKNAWEGTEFEQFGDALKAAIVLSVVGEGMPLIHSGQEAGNDRRLEFFERDPIVWREHPLCELYRKLFALKRTNTALWNARRGARMINVPNSLPANVFSFVRQNERDKVFAVLNLSAESRSVTFGESLCHGAYTDYLTNEPIKVGGDTTLTLEAWSARILVQEPGRFPAAAGSGTVLAPVEG
jgi:Maltogenic Amylase, C-terminal domain